MWDDSPEATQACWWRFCVCHPSSLTLPTVLSCTPHWSPHITSTSHIFGLVKSFCNNSHLINDPKERGVLISLYKNGPHKRLLALNNKSCSSASNTTCSDVVHSLALLYLLLCIIIIYNMYYYIKYNKSKIIVIKMNRLLPVGYRVFQLIINKCSLQIE